MVTHNRLAYTRLSLDALLHSRYPNFEAVVWDNNSTDGTQRWLVDNYGNDSRVTIVLANTNKGVVHPMNVVWQLSNAPLLAKVDNDTLIPANLLARLARYHVESKTFGVLSGCHFRLEDVGEAADFIDDESDKTPLLRQKHVGGCAVMMRRELFEQFGPIELTHPRKDVPYAEEGWTRYQQRLHRAGYHNGFPLPLPFVEHMEDTRSPFCLKTRDYQSYKQTMRGMSLEENTQRLCRISAEKCFGRKSDTKQSYFERERLAEHSVTLACLLDGNRSSWKNLVEYLDRQHWPHARTALWLYDMGGDGAHAGLVREWLACSDYCDVRHVQIGRGDGEAFPLNSRSVARTQLLRSQLFKRLATELSTDFVWILYDFLTPPDNVCERLLRHFDNRTFSVAAPYRDESTGEYCVWDGTERNYPHQGEGIQTVGGNGFGCALLRSRHFKQIRFSAIDDPSRQFYRTQSNETQHAKLDWSCECSSQNEATQQEPVGATP